MHLEEGYPNPTEHNFYLTLTLRGIRRCLGDETHRKSPVTPEILLGLRSVLNLDSVEDSGMWAAAIVAFFCLLRKSNLFPDTLAKANTDRQLTRGDFLFFSDKIHVTIKWSKTVQFSQRVRIIPLPAMPGSPFCPLTAVLQHFRITKEAGSTELAFLVNSKPCIPLTSPKFIEKLKDAITSMGLSSSEFSSHSFRRGGASYALQCGISSENIRILGDWKSNCYTSYIGHDCNSLLKVTSQLASNLVSSQ